MNEKNMTSPPFQLPLNLVMLSPVVQATVTSELREFVTDMAEQTKESIGFGWEAASVEHPSCSELNRRVASAIAHRRPLAIPGKLAERTLLGDVEAELALRYWRTVTKFRQTPCTCDAASEFACDMSMVDEAVLAGVSHTAQLYLYGDLVGATTLRLSGYGMAINPAFYTLDVLMFGLPEAVVMEAERRRG
ncbi:hypothetical protein, partial [Mesorhizobium japonicum]|uniref:hypothetical protein n=1 Tax=Mesorhizobium japonicum TaxID=2066070 RepID=UPI003B5C34E7